MAITYPTTLDVFTNPTSTSLLTSPNHAQQHSDINDAVEALEAKVAIGNTVLGTYTAFTPTFAGVTVGNGTFVTRYARVNNFVHYVGYFTLGTTSAVTGTVNIDLPISCSSTYSGLNGVPMGELNLFDTSASTWYRGAVFSIGSTTTVRTRIYSVSGTQIIENTSANATTPFTWATGDQFLWNITYQAA